MSVDMSAPSVRKKKSFARTSKASPRMCIREQITMSSPEVCWPAPMRAIGAQNLLTMPGGVTTAGYLHKKGGSQFSLLKWPLRYIIIHKGCVYYFKSSTSPAPQGAFSLNGYNRVMRAAEETTSNNVFPFKIIHFSKRHRTWFFSAASEDERRKWMRHLRREIDHYNDRKESHFPSDSDSDGDSFYGTIERPMDIKHPVDTTDVDYAEEDDDEDEEDYVKPDNDCSPCPCAGRPTGPPPSYPPPPVPALMPSRQDPISVFPKGSPLPILPLHRLPTSPLPRKPPPSTPPPNIRTDCVGPPPPMPRGLKLPSFSPPPPPPPNSKKPLQSRLTAVGVGKDGKSVPTLSVQSPATLPICDQLVTRLALNRPSHSLLTPGVSQSLGNNLHRPKPSLPPLQNSTLSVNHTSPSQPRLSPPMKTRLHNQTATAKPPVPAVRPLMPPPRSKQQGSAFQRASPEGQSFRSLSDETPLNLQKRPELSNCDGEEEYDDAYVDTCDDTYDDCYEDMLLPKSVFIDSNETSFVEKLFRESMFPPPDGLYGIRNSMTKTTKVLVVWDVSVGKARNYRVFEENNSVFLESDMTFPDLSALIEHYHGHPLPHHGSLCLQKPFTKCDNSGVFKKNKPH